MRLYNIFEVVRVLMHWRVNVLICWCAGVLLRWYVDMLIYWYDMLMCVYVCWCADVLMFWCADGIDEIVSCWCGYLDVIWCVDTDVLMRWCVLTCWCVQCSRCACVDAVLCLMRWWLVLCWYGCDSLRMFCLMCWSWWNVCCVWIASCRLSETRDWKLRMHQRNFGISADFDCS